MNFKFQKNGYVVAKVGRQVLIDEDIIPLKNEQWQTDATLDAYFDMLVNSSSEKRVKKIHFTNVAKIFNGLGVKEYRKTKRGLPLTSVCIILLLCYLQIVVNIVFQFI